MDVAAAVTVAKKYVKPKDERFAVVRFAPGQIVAQTEDSGVVIAAPDVTWEASTDATQLSAMLKKAGDGATMRLDGNTLVIEGKGTFRLQCLAPKVAAKLPRVPEAPSRFRVCPEDAVKALVAVAGLALSGDDDPTLATLRIAEGWAAASRGNGLAVLWFVDALGVPFSLVSEPTSVDAKFFAGLKGELGFGATKPLLWVQQGDVFRWARKQEVPWPDSTVSAEYLGRLRGGDNRVSSVLPVHEARALFDRAFAAADSKADVFRLVWGSELSLTGGGRRGRFSGSVPMPQSGGDRALGVAPAVWLRYLDALGACCGDVYFSLAGGTDPASMWGVKPYAFEVFVWPDYLPPQ